MYKKYLQNGDIAKGVIMGDVFHGEFKVPQMLDSQYGNKIDGVSHFKLTLPFVDRDITEEWDQANIQYTFKEGDWDYEKFIEDFNNILKKEGVGSSSDLNPNLQIEE